MEKITRCTLLVRNDESGYSRDSVEVIADGSLHGDAYDTGSMANAAWGRDYEYDLYVAGEWKDTIILLLIKERFTHVSEWRDWMKAQGIPYTEGGWW